MESRSSSIIREVALEASLDNFLDQVAHRGSWKGGGSVAALSAALAAALLEKLVIDSSRSRRLRAIRRECVELIERDARLFARVIQATRAQDRQAFRRALRAATDVPRRVYRHAVHVQEQCRRARRVVKPRFQSDLRCAAAVAAAAAVSAHALIATNLAWLNDTPDSSRAQHRTKKPVRAHA